LLSIKQDEEEQEENPMTIFMYALKAPDTRRQYPQRFKMFLDYLKLEGPLEKQADISCQKQEIIHNGLRKALCDS
jgi:hypothetical protein